MLVEDLTPEYTCVNIGTSSELRPQASGLVADELQRTRAERRRLSRNFHLILACNTPLIKRSLETFDYKGSMEKGDQEVDRYD